MMEERRKRIRLPEGKGEGKKRTRLRSPSPSPSPSLQQRVGVKPKDVCVCVRLIYNHKDESSCIKWLRLKIPSNLIEEFEPTDTDYPSISTVSHSSLACSSSSMQMGTEELDNYFEVGKVDGDEGKSEGKGKETEMEMEMEMETETPRDKDEDEHKHESPCSDASSTEYDPHPDILRSWREIRCRVDPINGPFDFTPLVKCKYCYPRFASCAALGSVIYALGGDLYNIGDRRLEYLNDASGFNITHPGKQPPPKRTITGPSVCGGRSLSITSPRPNNSGSSNVDTCHRFHLCDFGVELPKWQVSQHPLITPRYSPKLLSFDGKIYAFGGTHPTDDEAPFVEVYDPDLGFWEAIPNPPFGRLSTSELFVFPLPKSSDILVLGTYSDISYKFDTLSWMWYPFDACTGLGIRLFGKFKRDSSPVIFDDTIYWIQKYGALCAYRLGKDQAKGKYYEGFITGFEDLQIGLYLKETVDFPLALLPISRHLLGLFWCSSAPLDFGYYDGSCLHISLLRVSLLRELELNDYLGDCPDPSLTASVVTTLTFPFPMDSIDIIDAYLIDDEEYGRLLSSCRCCSIVSS